MDSIPFSHQDFPPDVVKPGSTFEGLTVEDIDILISEQQAKILEHEASIRAITMHYNKLIAHHHRAIARYRSCRNERTALINRVLPEEIFSEILLHYNFISRRSKYGYKRYYHWLKAAHVCRYWRNVVRSMPQLFCRIHLPVTSPTHLDEFILASRPLPLRVKCITSYPSNSNAWERMLPRTQSLYLATSPSLMHNVKWPICPAVSSLVWTYYITAFDLGPDDKVWPGGINCIMPNLQSLKIEMVFLGADWLLYPLPPSLATFTLHHSAMTRPQGTMADLIRTLTSLTSLRSIKFSGLKRTDYLSEPNVSMGGEIAHLKSLSLSGALTPISAFLHHVRVVDHVNLAVAPGDQLEELWLLPSMLRTKLSPVPSAGTSCTVPSIKLDLVIMDSVSTDLQLTIWVSSQPSGKVSSTLPIARLDLQGIRVPLADTFKLLEAFSNDLSDLFIPAKHFILVLHGRHDKPIDAMQNVLRQLWNVTHLTIELPRPEEYKQRDATSLISFPSVLTPSDSENQESAVLPNMRTLQIIANRRDETALQTLYVNTLGALRRRQDVYGLRLRMLELVVPSSFIPLDHEYHAHWQDIVDEQVIKIAE